MAHYALIENSIVKNVIVVDNNNTSFVSNLEGTWIQTSYNTRGGIHYGPDGLPDGGIALRKNYAGIGYTYDEVRDAFIPPVPGPAEEYVLNEDTCLWDKIPAPEPEPE